MLRSGQIKSCWDALAYYAMIHWAFHCQKCGSVRSNKSPLKELFSSFIGKGLVTTTFQDWVREISRSSVMPRKPSHWYPLIEADFEMNIQKAEYPPISPFSMACLFNFWEVMEEVIIEDKWLPMGIAIASRYGHIRVVSQLLEKRSKYDLLLNTKSLTSRGPNTVNRGGNQRPQGRCLVASRIWCGFKPNWA